MKKPIATIVPNNESAATFPASMCCLESIYAGQLMSRLRDRRGASRSEEVHPSSR